MSDKDENVFGMVGKRGVEDGKCKQFLKSFAIKESRETRC